MEGKGTRKRRPFRVALCGQMPPYINIKNLALQRMLNVVLGLSGSAWGAHLWEQALALRPRPWPKAALGPAPERTQSRQRRRGQVAPGSVWLLWGPWLSCDLGDPMGRWGGSLGGALPRAMVSKFNRVVRIDRFLGGFEVAPLHFGRCHAFSIPGTGRACSRAAQPRSPFLDGAASADRWIPDRPGLRARTGRKSPAQALRS